MSSKTSWRRKISLVTIAVLIGAITVIYLDDPWYWRRYVNFFASTQSDGGLEPFEVVQGDNSLSLPVAADADRTVDPAALEAARAYAAEFDSYSLIVIHGGVIQYEWYAEGWNRDRLTESQSMHKTLMGLAIGIAIEDQVIESVDDPVGRYISEWRDDPRGDITLKQLLQMSSGLDQYAFTLNPFNDGLKWLNASDSVTPLLATPLADWPPGSRYDYNNLNSELLGLIVERVTGQRYAKFLEERVWRPMGADRAHVWLDSEGGTAHTSCCLATPAMDWAKFGLLLLQRGEINGNRIVGGDWIDAMVVASENAYWYGYQIWLGYEDPPFPPGAGSTQPIASEPYDARDTYLTWGRGQQHVWVIPSRDLVVVRLGPALGRQPIKPGFDVPRIPNLIMRGMTTATAQPRNATRRVALP